MQVRNTILVLAVMLFSWSGFAQSFFEYRHKREFAATIGGGVNSYHGDLSGDGIASNLNYVLEAGVEYRVTGRISGRFTFSYLRMSADDAKTANSQRNLRFRSGNLELGVAGSVLLFDEGKPYYSQKMINPYGVLGFAMLRMKPGTDIPEGFPDAGKYVPLQPYMTEGVEYSKWQPVIPLGIGVKLAISYYLSVKVEGVWRMTFTDYLDDVSSVYPGAGNFTDPLAAAFSDRRPELGLPPAEAGSSRGNPSNNDNYISLNIKLAWYIPGDLLSTKHGVGARFRN